MLDYAVFCTIYQFGKPVSYNEFERGIYSLWKAHSLGTPFHQKHKANSDVFGTRHAKPKSIFYQKNSICSLNSLAGYSVVALLNPKQLWT